MFFRQIREPSLAQYAYLIGCQRTRQALVVDPQRDVDVYRRAAADEGLRLVAAAETHIHADFLSGAREMADRLGARVYLSAEGGESWSYRWPEEDGCDCVLLRGGDRFELGGVAIEAVHTPGHTPEHLSFVVTDRGSGASDPLGVASGDFVFVGDLGRPDLLETAAGEAGARRPAAEALYGSVQAFLENEDHLQVWPGHGAGSSCGKALGAVPASTVGYERRHNAAIAAAGRGRDAFVEAILAGQPEPPLYFARMKRLNRDGPPLLGVLPEPRELDAAGLAALAGRDDAVVVDGRPDRREFMAAHLGGSLWIPFGRDFTTLAGCYVDEGAAIHLVVEAQQLDEAVRRLIRVGLDRVEGWASPATLEVALARPGAARSTEVRSFAELAADGDGHLPLDVRGAAEVEAGKLPDALHVAHTRLAAHLDELPRDRPLAVHCASGHRAAAATSLLERHGHRVVHVDDDFGRYIAARG